MTRIFRIHDAVFWNFKFAPTSPLIEPLTYTGYLSWQLIERIIGHREWSELNMFGLVYNHVVQTSDMNACALCRPHFCRSSLVRCSLSFHVSRRRVFVHNGSGLSSTLSRSLDVKRTDIPKRDTLGPFQLGIEHSTVGKKGGKAKKWSEISVGRKVLRTTKLTASLSVILIGVGLSALLVYSLTSELFSKNSPTVLYGDACERIKASPKVEKHIRGPLTFHNNSPSDTRPRHRNRHVLSQILVDQYGQEHMMMTFYVQGQSPASSAVESGSFHASTTKWYHDHVSAVLELSLDKSISSVQEIAKDFWSSTKDLIRFLSGSPVPSPTLQPSSSVSIGSEKSPAIWSLANMFLSLRGSKHAHSTLKQTIGNQIFTEGQVHAHLVRNQAGYFVFRYLLIDMPSSHDPNSVRVFVERASGVREYELVLKGKSGV